eukprot:scaffold607_cov160-Ochromonas_danica.AAC.33
MVRMIKSETNRSTITQESVIESLSLRSLFSSKLQVYQLADRRLVNSMELLSSNGKANNKHSLPRGWAKEMRSGNLEIASLLTKQTHSLPS